MWGETYTIVFLFCYCFFCGWQAIKISFIFFLSQQNSNLSSPKVWSKGTMDDEVYFQ